MSSNMTSPSIPTYIHSLLPTALHPFVSLSYPVAPSHSPLVSKLRITTSHRPRESVAPQLYGQGPKDVYFVAFCALAFTVLREICIRYVLSTFAKGWLKRARRKEYEARGEKMRSLTKLEKRKMAHTTTRFAEQGWSFLYCTLFWSLGAVSDVSPAWGLQLTSSTSYLDCNTPFRPSRYGRPTRTRPYRP
jgi:acyl-CoA-dependent ceramide synthase